MAVTTIPWGDGSGDNIYLTYPSASGDQTIQVTSDAYTGSTDRTKTITFTASHHGTSDTKTLTVVQEGVPEQYIVFADPVVEQICATKWGDGVGIKPSQAAQVTNSQLGTTFRGNTEITSFDELQYFTGLTQIAVSGFQGCSALQSVVVPEGVTLINAFAFRGCTVLVSVSLPSTLTTMSGSSNFRDCPSLATINFPEGLISIPSSCFYGASSLELPALPSTLTSIGGYAFFNCSNLTKYLVIPSSVNIGEYTFQNCNGIESARILCGTIPSNSFIGCTSLTSVEVGANCTSIGIYAFWFVGTTTNKCTYILRPTTPPTLGGTSSFTAARINKIYVPNGTLSAYQTASNWSNFASYMAELDANGNIPT